MTIMSNSEQAREEMKPQCSICLYGDGQWDKGRNTTGYSHLPVCNLCAKDGWKVATSKDILEDPTLRTKINHRII